MKCSHTHQSHCYYDVELCSNTFTLVRVNLTIIWYTYYALIKDLKVQSRINVARVR